MGRRRRDEQPGESYHLTTRGNNRGLIRRDDVDCVTWQRLLAAVTRRFGWEVLAFSFLPNHFHLVIRIPLGGLSRGMQMLNGGYARQFNKRHARRDHVFGRRFWSKRAPDRAYLIGALRYTDLNAVRAGLVDMPEDYRWCSHAAIVGLVEPPSFLAVDSVLELFSPDPAKARAAYRRFVLERLRVPCTATEL